MEFTRGIIENLSGHPMSGLWTLQVSGKPIHIQSGHGVRQLAAAFDATEGSGDLMEKIREQDIVYSTDFLGVMEAFTPYADWSGPDIQLGETVEINECQICHDLVVGGGEVHEKCQREEEAGPMEETL